MGIMASSRHTIEYIQFPGSFVPQTSYKPHLKLSLENVNQLAGVSTAVFPYINPQLTIPSTGSRPFGLFFFPMFD